MNVQPQNERTAQKFRGRAQPVYKFIFTNGDYVDTQLM